MALAPYELLEMNIRLISMEALMPEIFDVIKQLREVNLQLLQEVAQLKSRVNILERITDESSQDLPTDSVEVSPTQSRLGPGRPLPDGCGH